ncbi:hypothetical protein [Maridesulfovibrio sp.]|uniref:hypothetical protein n=1 Tax=Maridesulfovibrio sp. TaxID=2795000 RepID=UPI002A18BB5E|nr:hypothetical protein [Maridesulfovibrio sp.]
MKDMKKASPSICAALLCLLLCLSVSGCMWGAAAAAGVAVVTANIDEYQESQHPTNSTEDLDEYLAHRKKVHDKLEKGSPETEAIDINEIIDTYDTDLPPN